jgi:hypothetical protein
MDLISLIVGAAGTLVTVLVAIKGRQLWTPKLELSVGHAETKDGLPRAVRSLRATTIVFGTVSNRRPRVAAIPFFLHNPSAVPITDLSLRVEYPGQQLLKDGLLYTVDGATRLIRLTEDPRSGRTAQTILGKAYVEFDVGLLRPRDTEVLTDFLFLHALDLAGQPSSQSSDERVVRATNRFRSVPGFQAFTPIDIVARSSNGVALATSLNLIWIVADSPATLSAHGDALASLAWSGRRPKPGVYLDLLKPIRRRRWAAVLRRERFSFLFLEGDGDTVGESPQQLGERTLNADLTIGIFQVPQWGLAGKEFDIEKLLGRRVRDV